VGTGHGCGELYPELDTPALVVDVDVMEGNLAAMAEGARRRGVALRPHIKTHKSPWIAHRQLAHGAVGVTAAKLGEAQVMADAGITDILVAYPIVGELKLRRLEALLDMARVTVALDSLEAAEPLSRLGRRRGEPIPVYMEVDTGLRRLGVPPASPEALDLARKLAALPGLRLAGITTHGGHVARARTYQELARLARAQAEALVATADMLRRAGLPVDQVSTGSTPAARFELEVDGITEIRPGTYVFYDANCVAQGVVPPERCAARIVATVVSRPAPDRAVIDAGSKTISPEAREDGSYGIVVGRPDLILNRLSEEHGIIELHPAARGSGGAIADLAVGHRLAIIPNHICPCVNLSDVLYAARGGRILWEIPVAARGARR